MDTLTALASRISTRAYQPQQISDADLNTILGAGSSAPIGLGDYSYPHFTVVQSSELLARLHGDSKGQPFYGAPTLVIISSKELPYPGVEYFNTACIMENMFIAATALGLGSYFASGASGVANSDPDLLAALQLPEGYTPVSSVALGFSQEPLQEKQQFKNGISVNRIR